MEHEVAGWGGGAEASFAGADELISDAGDDWSMRTLANAYDQAGSPSNRGGGNAMARFESEDRAGSDEDADDPDNDDPDNVPRRFSVSSATAAVRAWLLDPLSLKLLFGTAYGAQIVLLLVLFLIQQHVKDAGLFLALSWLGALILGLQSGQTTEHFRGAEKKKEGENAKPRKQGDLLWAQPRACCPNTNPAALSAHARARTRGTHGQQRSGAATVVCD